MWCVDSIYKFVVEGKLWNYFVVIIVFYFEVNMNNVVGILVWEIGCEIYLFCIVCDFNVVKLFCC